MKNPFTHLVPNKLSSRLPTADPLWVKTVYNAGVILLSWELVCSLRLTNPTNQVPLVVATKDHSAQSEWCPPGQVSHYWPRVPIQAGTRQDCD